MAHFRFTDSGDARIRFLDSGGDDLGAPVIFVPGFTDIADDYTEAVTALGRRTAVVELRGHGRSSAPPEGYDSDTLAADVAAVVDALTDGPVHLMTFSRGTPYAVVWALANPGRVLSLSIGDYVPEEITLPDDVIVGLLDGRWRGTPVHERVDRNAGLATVRAARAQSFWEPLARWQPPLCVVRSPNSPLISAADWSRYRQLFPEARLEEFADSPHDIFRPDRGRYPALVREHIGAVESG
ncbi:putative hydrolase or acyltransferase of alpha/beta superfamily [Mycolicibacterium chubuense NBB4]|uniref:Putative hydrolase or acyltransferase of alpha/beta superfamily n=1 Tax=Mycolicibacterium chubuense (strain NBB4) TaxID=710421 RepID=I4BNB6_MYCCN|nr:alpha/beta fold hydrolase [Mycolicibacterium chubuense]AFM18773.1 putative hydrolase or acyltransferase of alpha/beta superfamily [Mycolicibacterium chubuense NBB4]